MPGGWGVAVGVLSGGGGVGDAEEDLGFAVDGFVGDDAAENDPCLGREGGEGLGEEDGDAEDLGVGGTAGHEDAVEAHAPAVGVQGGVLGDELSGSAGRPSKTDMISSSPADQKSWVRSMR